jgi:hypothetical protein
MTGLVDPKQEMERASGSATQPLTTTDAVTDAQASAKLDHFLRQEFTRIGFHLPAAARRVDAE